MTGRPVGGEIKLPSGRTDTNNTAPFVAVQDDGTALAVLGTIGNGYREAVVRRLALENLPDYGGDIMGDENINTLTGSSSTDDIIVGKRSADTMKGKGGDDILLGGKGADKLFGGRGDDVLEGGRGNDVMRGSKGNDVLVAGTGKDKMYGGPGEDTFVFREGIRGQDARIMDFTIGVDTIEITGYGPGGSPSPGQTLTAEGLLLEWNLNSPDPDCSVLLRGITQTLTQSDFLLV